jgi:Ca2+-binding EF-hand superfamily protein
MFALMNMVTGIFVDASMQTGQYSRDLIEDKAEQLRQNQMESLREIFAEIDIDGDEGLVEEELAVFLSNKRFLGYLQALHVNTDDAKRLFKVLDFEGIGAISADDFVAGIMKIKGQASSLDVRVIEHSLRRISDKMNGMAKNQQKLQAELGNLLKR